jgi:hypothetical protein
VATGSVAACLLSVAPALAALSYVESTGVITTTGAGQATASCPASSFVIGGGAFSTGQHTEVAITGSLPGSSTQWTEFTDVFFGTETHYAYAICDPRAPVARVGSGEITVDGSRRLRARCPGDKNVYGGGFGSGGDYEKTITRSSRPFDDKDRNRDRDDGWEATFANFYPDPAEASVYVLCGPKEAKTVSNSSEIAPFTQESVARGCPGDDRVTGGGAHISAGATRRTWIRSIYPEDRAEDADSVADDAWKAFLENDDGQVERTITAYAVCR